MANVNPGVSRDRVPNLAGRCDPVVERAIRDLYLRFYKFPAPVTNVTQTTTTVAPVAVKKSTGTLNAYTIVFTIDGLVGDDQMTPSFTVNPLRDGFAPATASLTADFAPDGGDLKINFFLEGDQMLSDDLTLPDGETGPVQSTVWALPNKIPANKRIRMKIVQGSSAGQVVGEIVMKKLS